MTTTDYLALGADICRAGLPQPAPFRVGDHIRDTRTPEWSDLYEVTDCYRYRIGWRVVYQAPCPFGGKPVTGIGNAEDFALAIRDCSTCGRSTPDKDGMPVCCHPTVLLRNEDTAYLPPRARPSVYCGAKLPLWEPKS